MTGNAASRPPLWARNNARKAIELMDGTPAYVSLYKVRPKTGRVIQKPAAEAMLKSYLLGMQAEGRVLITGERKFIAPCLGTVFVSDGEEIERNVMLSRIEYKIQKSGVVTKIVPFLNIPHHAIARIFERDLRPPSDVAQALVSETFIQSVLQLHALGDPECAENSFAIRFLDGFLTGTVRQMAAGPEFVETKILDLRTFLHKRDKPEWVRKTQQVPFTTFKYSDRRSENAEAGKLADLIESLSQPATFGIGPMGHKDLPPGV